jgi:hypothetical protein
VTLQLYYVFKDRPKLKPKKKAPVAATAESSTKRFELNPEAPNYYSSGMSRESTVEDEEVKTPE